MDPIRDIKDTVGESKISNGVKRIAVYAGSFDPVTYGHIDIIKRAGRLFDRVIVAIARNSLKKPFFSVKQRMAMLKKAAGSMPNIKVEKFNGLLVDYVSEKGASILIRGLRMVSDFEYEFQMALTNRKLNEKIETIFLMPKDSYSYLSSALIKEAASLGADMSNFVPPFVEKEFKKRFKKK
ncbi:MAG: pantetheine-phosphate adenylyltransferase [Candidatus Omnitrophota bacterium]|nr:pantetheine-phosphate adenylyltransferase [Candidatus Omnitrophota bacterium]